MNSRNIEVSTIKEKLYGFSSCWIYGIKKDYVKENPWHEILQNIKVPPKQQRKPFTNEEVTKIFDTIHDHKVYSFYQEYIEFILRSGCRLGEAAALCWRHFNEDCSTVWFGESIDAIKQRKSTKTNKVRTVWLTPRLQQMMLNRRGEKWSENDLVFPARSGTVLNLTYFSCVWTRMLKEAGVQYREPRKMRSTWISHALQNGMSPMDAAEIAGNTPQVIYKNYLGSVVSRQTLPSLWEDSNPTSPSLDS